MTQQSTHESLTRAESIAPGSDRRFGIVMAIVFAALASVNLWHHGRVWLWLFVIAALFAATAILRPAALRPLNVVWFRFGLLLHRVVNPIIMGLVFYGAVLPTGLVMRALGQDLLRLKIERDRDSYWIKRQPLASLPHTMKDQF
jgi:hypothetical protein